MSRRRQLSVEALDRAVRSKLVQELGIEASCIVVPVRILPVKSGSNQQNWRVDLRGVEASCLQSLERAAAAIGRTFDLRMTADPLADATQRAVLRAPRHTPRDPDL